MARKTTVLFGAGASKDAGLPDAYELTKQVYDKIVDAKSNDAVLYAAVVAKLIARNAKNGKSPFSPINIEDVYDGLKRLLNRDSDILSEFVSGWDSISAASRKPFDTQAFARSLVGIFEFTNRRSLRGETSLHVNQRQLQQAVAELDRCFGGDLHQYRGGSLEPFLTTLADILNTENAQTGYMQEFLSKHSDNIECIATLNYDKLVEDSLDKIGRSVDLGLTYWNEKRFVRFHGKSVKLIKLHGSTNWFLKSHDEIALDDPGLSVFPPSRAMIFGGQSDKLVPYGPFLHLRHQFHRFLQGSTHLLIVGYSFRDLHLNALIRSWIATRMNGKIIIVDPGEFEGDKEVFRYAQGVSEDGKPKTRVQIKEIKQGFADALPAIEAELKSNPRRSTRH